MRVLTAGWVFPVASPPIQAGAVAIRGGRIVGVGSARDVGAAWPAADRWDLQDAALLPGLVNCHTHLELGEVVQPAGEGGFIPWVVALIDGRREIAAAAPEATSRAGAQALLSSGTTAGGDVSSSGQSLPFSML